MSSIPGVHGGRGAPIAAEVWECASAAWSASRISSLPSWLLLNDLSHMRWLMLTQTLEADNRGAKSRGIAGVLCGGSCASECSRSDSVEWTFDSTSASCLMRSYWHRSKKSSVRVNWLDVIDPDAKRHWVAA